MNQTFRRWTQPAWVAAACIAGALGQAVRADYPAAVLAQNPEIYYRLDSTAAAPVEPPAANLGSVGAPANGAYVGAPTRGLAGAISGDADTSIRVSGAQVVVPWGAAHNPTGPFTVEAWVKPAAVPTGLTSPLASVRAGAPRAGWLFYQLENGGGWNFRTYNQNGTATSVNINAAVPVTVDTWYHLVATYDGTTVRLYVDGVEGAAEAPTGYVGNPDSPLTLGSRSDFAFAWQGGIDELALYNSALTPAEVTAHFTKGSTGTGAAYSTQVLASSPTVYLRLGEAPTPLPVVTNSGTLGATADGNYLPGSTPGVPSLSATVGFPSTNKAVAFNGSTGSIKVPPQSLVTAQATILAWVYRDGVQGEFTGLVYQRGAGAPATGLSFSGNGVNLTYNWQDLAGAYNFNPGFAVPDKQWTFVALTVDPTQAVLYMGTAAGLVSATNVLEHPEHDFAGGGVVLDLGKDNTSAVRSFKGSLDEVALFAKTLTPEQVQAVYAAALPAITGIRQTPANPIYEGLDVSFEVAVAKATGTVTYQWRKDGVDLPSQTAAKLTLPSVKAVDVASYDVVAKVGATSLTSAPIALAIVSSAPVLTTVPAPAVRLLNGATRFTVAAVGTQPMTYVWKHDGAVLTGETGPTLLLTDLQAADAGEYSVTVSNSLGSSTAAASLTLVTPSGFAAAATDAGPIGYWRLNEASGTTAFDLWGGRDGRSGTGVTVGVAGPAGTGFPGGNTGYSFNNSAQVEVPALNVTRNTFTIIAWIKPTGEQEDYDGIVFSRGGSTVSGLDYQQGNVLGYHWNDTASTYGWSSGLTPTDGAWNFVALVVEPAKATIYLDGGTGLTSAVNEVEHAPAQFNGLFRFGTDGNGGRFFNGSIDEVVMYDRALSETEITTLQVAGTAGTYAPKPLQIVASPKSRTVMAGTSQLLTGRAAGSVPLSYQWQKDGADIPGAIRSQLAIAPAAVEDTGSYRLVVKQGATTATTTPAVVTVKPVPSYLDAREGLVLHLPFDSAYTDSSGRNNNGTAVGTPTFTAGAIGSAAVQVRTVVEGGAVTQADYVTLGTPADLAFGTGSFTVSFWTKFTGSPGDLPFFCNNVDSFGGAGFVFAPSFGTGSWSWSLNDGPAPVGFPGKAAQYGNDAGYPDALNNGVWHNVVHVVDRAGDVTTWVDGVKVHEKSIAGIDFDVNTGLNVNIGQGANGDYGVPAVIGIDDMGVWRRALTDFEAQAIYVVGALGRSFDVPAPAPVVLTFGVTGSNLVLGWTAGTLEGAPSVTGPWTPVPDTAAPTATIVPSADLRFFRVAR